jgi:hypothetical protein
VRTHPNRIARGERVMTANGDREPEPVESNPIAELSDRLDRLARTRENPETRREVEAALSSKWEGVRANAAKVLGIWGGRRSVDVLREALESSMEKRAGWALRTVLVRALCQCTDPVEDAPWMLDCYFNASFHSLSRAGQWEFWPFVSAVPKPVLRERVEIELRSATKDRAEAAERARAWLERSGN